MTDITIPPEALEAAESAYCEAWDRDEPALLAACLAMLRAWPGMHLGAPWVIGVPNATSIILPLPPEKEPSA